MKIEIKKSLWQKCNEFADLKISTAQKAISDVQSSANEESKSSMGDKYETGREMMHLEKAKFAFQLNEGLKLKKLLVQIDPNKTFTLINLGSVVLTTNGNFYISVNAGKINVNDQEYFCISLASPIGMQMKGLGTDDSFELNGRKYKIKTVL